jgi:hypothetical protein
VSVNTSKRSVSPVCVVPAAGCSPWWLQQRLPCPEAAACSAACAPSCAGWRGAWPPLRLVSQVSCCRCQLLRRPWDRWPLVAGLPGPGKSMAVFSFAQQQGTSGCHSNPVALTSLQAHVAAAVSASAGAGWTAPTGGSEADWGLGAVAAAVSAAAVGLDSAGWGASAAAASAAAAGKNTAACTTGRPVRFQH